MPDKEPPQLYGDPDTMMQNASSLGKLAKKLYSDQESNFESEEDMSFFEGTFLAVPVLYALAVEIALKAWQCYERKGEPDREHDLLFLFEGLTDETRKLLEARLPRRPDPLGMEKDLPVGAGGGMKKTLEFHRNSFVEWRYLHEKTSGQFYSPALDEALTVIIETYQQAREKEY